MAEDRDGRSSEEIRRSIARTRSNLDETVDTLEDRLAPKKLMNEAWDRIRDRGDDLGSRVGATAREHPIPIALAGLGLAWLVIEEIRGRSISFGSGEERDVETHAPAEGRVGPYGRDAINTDDPDWAHASRTAKVKARARGLTRKAGEAARGARHARRHVARFVDENPLAVGVIAFGLGLASAMSVPSTDAESRVAGRASDTVKREARKLGRDMKDEAEELGREKVRETAHEATERAARIAEDAARAARDDVRASPPPPPPYPPATPPR